MSDSTFLHHRFQAMIEGSLRSAAARGSSSEATLIGIVSESSPFSRYDRRAQRNWHEELHHQIRQIRLQIQVDRRES